jgi:hypothetical protein
MSFTFMRQSGNADGRRTLPLSPNICRAAELTGRPLGNADFIVGLERVLNRPIARRAPGRRPKQQSGDQMKLI